MDVKNSLVVVITLFFMMPVMALSDSFTNYSTNYLILDNTTPQGWIAGYDTTSIGTDSLMKNEGSAFRVHVNTLLTSENRASVYKDIPSKNISSFMSQDGKSYLWFKPTDISGITSIKMRLSTNSSNYYEYTTTNPFGINFIAGAQLISFNLKSPSTIVGNPQPANITRVQIIVSYASSQPDFDYTINRIWIEKNPSAFLTNWQVPLFGGKPDGWGLPYSDASEGNVLSLTSTDLPTLGEHGRIYYHGEPTAGVSLFNIETDMRIVNAKWGTRLFFDFIDGFNFSSVFLSNQYNKVGIETYVNNVRTYSQVSLTIVPGKTYKVRYSVRGTRVSVYVDNVHMLDWDVPIRRTGELGLESFQGTSHFSQFTYT